MSYSIIKDLYYSNRGTHEHVRVNEDYLKALDKCNNAYENLEKVLNEEQKELLVKYFDSTGVLEIETAFLNYREGYKIGLLTGVECMQK